VLFDRSFDVRRLPWSRWPPWAALIASPKPRTDKLIQNRFIVNSLLQRSV
jgi:hypothetical protein